MWINMQGKCASSISHVMLFQGYIFFSGCHEMRYISPLKTTMKAFRILCTEILIWRYFLLWNSRGIILKLLYGNSLFEHEAGFLLVFLFCQLSLGVCVKMIQVSLFRRRQMYFAVSFCIFASGANTCLCFHYYSETYQVICLKS